MVHVLRVCRVVLFSLCLELAMAAAAAAHTPTRTFGNTPTPSPTSNRPIPQARIFVFPNPARSGATVFLSGDGSTGAIFSFEWVQIGGTVPVQIVNPSSSGASFVAPAVSEVTTITIQLRLRSFGGTSGDTEQVEVVILPPATVQLILGEGIGAPGDTVSVAATFHSAGQATSEIDHEIAFEPTAPIAATGEGAPDCSFDSALQAITVASSFGFIPEDCQAGTDCEGVAVSIMTAQAIPDGVLYRCKVELTDQPAESCESALVCVQPSAAGPSARLVLDCTDGAVRSEFSTRRLSFDFDVQPPEPRVGDPVTVTVSVFGFGGLPSYRLLGAEPFLDGDTGPIEVSGPLVDARFDLVAMCPGTANLRLSAQYETEMGCPGNRFFGFTSDASAEFPLQIVDPPQFMLSGVVTEFPLCSGAMRGVSVRVDPLGLSAETSLSDGSFSFAVPEGDYTLTVTPPCNPFGCWPDTPVSVVGEDVFVSICPVEGITPTITPTATVTATLTATPSATPSPSPTPTSTATITGTPPTPTPTRTETVTPTSTKTETTSASPTSTPAATTSVTVTPPSPTATSSATSTPSSPTASQTPTPSATSTTPPAPTHTATRTSSANATATIPSPSSTATPSATRILDNVPTGADGGCEMRAGGGRDVGRREPWAVLVGALFWLLRRARPRWRRKTPAVSSRRARPGSR